MPADDEGGRRWVVEPPPTSGEVALYVACGEGFELTDEQQAALGALLQSLEAADAEVTGHTPILCPPEARCNLACPKVHCDALTCTLNKVAAAAAAAPSGWNLMGSFGARTR